MTRAGKDPVAAWTSAWASAWSSMGAGVRRRLLAYYYAGALVVTLGCALALAFNFGGASVAEESSASASHLLSGGHLSVFDAQGKRLYEVRSDRVDHAGDSEYLNFNNTKMVYETERGRMRIHSGEGRFLPREELVMFDGEVHVKRMDDDGRVAEELVTRALTVRTRDNIAQGVERAEIRRDGRVIAGEGVEIDLENGKLKLLNNVRMQ